MMNLYILLIIVLCIFIVRLFCERHVALGILSLILTLGLIINLDEKSCFNGTTTINTYEVLDIIYDKEDDAFIVVFDKEGMIESVILSGDQILYDTSANTHQIEITIDKHERCPACFLNIEDKVSYKLILAI